MSQVPEPTREISIQTPTHFNEPNKDPKYTWNEWELRRRAVQTVINHLQKS